MTILKFKGKTYEQINKKTYLKYFISGEKRVAKFYDAHFDEFYFIELSKKERGG